MRADSREKPLPLEAATLLTEGKLIDAIKSVRQSEGLGLKEAKNRVDEHLAQNPVVRVQIETLQREARRKFFLWFLLVDLLVAAAAIYWLFYRGHA